MKLAEKREIISKYLGKSYVGIHPCFLFVQDFYRNEFGIELIDDYLELLQTLQVVTEPVLGDLITFEQCLKKHIVISGMTIIDHVGVYLGANEFIHGGAFDRQEVVVNKTNIQPYKSRFVQFLRHPKNDKN
jgi:cell wall-associated NlpC family hydrolase